MSPEDIAARHKIIRSCSGTLTRNAHDNNEQKTFHSNPADSRKACQYAVKRKVTVVSELAYHVRQQFQSSIIIIIPWVNPVI
ncbi:hypothetical protein VTP01DRAFT_1532 [Rhizomucor pusillus]|uniref:uncharacterized protein n=1 Tax=Rhizomucor pusillus TaxID=4840 RepID=UPI003742212D